PRDRVKEVGEMSSHIDRPARDLTEAVQLVDMLGGVQLAKRLGTDLGDLGRLRYLAIGRSAACDIADELRIVTERGVVAGIRETTSALMNPADLIVEVGTETSRSGDS